MLKKIVYPGDRLPTCYGLAYFEKAAQWDVAYPYPLNWIIGAIRWVWEFYHMHLRDFPGCNTPFAQALDKRYKEGQNRGYKRGYDLGWEEGRAEVIRVMQDFGKGKD